MLKFRLVQSLKQDLFSMTDIQIKLNELVTSQDINTRQRGSLYTLNNSLKRNTLYPPALSRHDDLGYDCKLPQMNLKRKDLTKILELILSKEEMSLSDRNFLRRILVNIFDEQLICSGSRHFINHLKLLVQKVHDTITEPEQRLFYFVLKGAVIVKSGGFIYKKCEGQTFGQIELLSNEPIQSITYTQNTLMLTLSQVNFDNYFRYYFQKLYLERMSHVSCIEEKYIQEIPEINRYFFLNQIQFESFNPGDKIIEMGRPVNRIYFVGNNWKGQLQSNLVDGCFGLKEVMKNKENYLESAYSLDLGYKVAFVQKEAFVKYVKDFLNISNYMSRSLIHTRVLSRNPQEKLIGKMMNIKQVKIRSKTKKMHTEPFDSIMSEFKFFKNQDLQVVMSPKILKYAFNNKNIANIVSSKRKSQSIQLKPSQKKLF